METDRCRCGCARVVHKRGGVGACPDHFGCRWFTADFGRDDEGPRAPTDRSLVTSERDWLTDPDDDTPGWERRAL